MWNDRIRNTALSTPAANWFFGTEHPLNIELSDERSTTDVSLLSTLRFLLFDKVKGEKVKVIGAQTGTAVNESSITYRVRRYYGRCDHDIDSCLIFIETSESPDSLKHNLETEIGVERTEGNLLPSESVYYCGTVTSRSTGEEIPINLEYQQSITYFFGNKFGVYVFTNAEKRISLVVTSRLNNQKFHWLQSVIPMLMPWYWAGDNGSVNLDQPSLKLLEKLNSTDKDGYLAILKDFADRLGFEDTYVDTRLREFLVSSQRKLINNAQDEVDNMRRRLQEIMRDIGTYTKSINEKLAYITGMELAVENAQTNEFAQYVRGNESIKVSEFNEGSMTIICHGCLEYYDPDQLQTLLDNDRSYIYSVSSGTKLGDGKMAKLLKALFIDESIRLKVFAPYNIDVSSNNVYAISGESSPAGFEDYLPNPHIYHHACIGDYTSTMSQYVREGNWIGVVEQCIASNSTMNFFDSTVTRELVADLITNYDTRKCIVLPDGSEVTIEGAIEYLEKE